MPCGNFFPILGIDPGTNTAGYAIVIADIFTLEVHHAEAWTVNASQLITKNDWPVQLYGERFGKIEHQKLAFRDALYKYNPIIVACESPYYNPHRPEAYAALLEFLHGIRDTLYLWDRQMVLNLVEPAPAKKNIGVKGNSGDKELIKQAIANCPDYCMVDTTNLDEHSIDALLIAKYKLDELRRKHGTGTGS